MSAPEFGSIEVAVDGAVGRLLLARPDKLNPLGPTTLDEITAAAGWFDEQPEIKVVIVGGQGRAFSAGADVAAFAFGATADPSPREAADAGRIMADSVASMRAVTIASVHGYCIGGGLVLAVACDLRVAAVGTSFAIPEVDLGIPLAWGAVPRLVREIGPAATKDLVMTCRSFDAAEAGSMGLVSRVVRMEDLESVVDDLATVLAAKSSLTLQMTKQHVDAVADGMADPAMSWSDADALVTALHDPESRAVAHAYLERLGRRQTPLAKGPF